MEEKDLLQFDISKETVSTGYADVFSGFKEDEARQKQRDAIASAESGKVVDTFIKSAIKQSIGYDVLNYFQEKTYSNIPSDDTKFTEDIILNALEINKLPMSSYKDLAKSKSQKELDYRILDAREKVRFDTEVNNTLSESQRIGASLTTIVPEVVGGILVGNLTGAGASIMRVAVYEGAYEATLAGTKLLTQENYSAEDLAIDVVAGTLLSTGGAKLAHYFDNTRTAKQYTNEETINVFTGDYTKQYTWFNSKPLSPEEVNLQTIRKNIQNQIDEGKIKQAEFEKQKFGTPEYESEQARLIEVRRNIRKQMGLSDEDILNYEVADAIDNRTFFEWRKDMDVSISKTEKRLEELQVTPEDALKNKDKIDSLKSKLDEDTAKLNSKEAKVREQEYEIMKQQEEDLIIELEEEEFRFKRNEELAERFKDKKYDNYTENRRVFFEKQNNIQARLLDEKLTATKQVIKSIESKLAELNTKIKNTTSPVWKKRYESQKINLKKELASEKEKISVSLDKKPLTKQEIHLKNLVDEMAEDVHNIKDELFKVVKEANPEQIKGDLENLIKGLHNKFPKEMEQVMSLVKSKLNNKTIEELRISGKVPKAIALSALLAVGASASDGTEDYKTEMLSAFILAAVIIPMHKDIYRAIKNANLRHTLSTMNSKMKSAYDSASARMSPEAGIVRRVSSTVAESLHTRLTSTIAPFEKAGGKALEIANNLLYGKSNGDGAEMTKHMWNQSSMSEYSRAERQGFREWKQENGIFGTVGIFDELNNISVFRQTVSDQMILRTTKSPAILKSIATNDKILTEVYDRAREMGVKGFENIHYKAGMLPRLWNNGGMHNVVTKLSDFDKNKIVQSIANAIYKTSGDMDGATKTAQGFMDSWGRGYSNEISRSAEDIYSVLSGHFKDDVEFEDVADSLGQYKDLQSRAKYRIDFNHFDIEDVKVNLDGVDVIVGRTEMINNDVKTIIDKTVNQLNGSSALAKKGYKSIAELNMAIDEIKDVPNASMLRQDLQNIRDLVLGIPVNNNDINVHNISMIVKDMTIMAKLPFVVFSLGQEMINLLGTGGMVKGIRHLAESLAYSFGKDSYMMNEMSKISGLATNIDRLDFSGFRGVATDANAIDDLSNASKIRNMTMKARDYSLYLNRLLSATDMFQRAGMMLNTEKLARFIKLNDFDTISGINPDRLSMFGIGKDKVDMLKDKFEFNSKGALKNIDFAKWTSKEKDAYGEILRAMNQTISPEDTLGETALYSHTTDIGRMFSTLSKYPMQQFNVHGLKDMEMMDKTSLVHLFGAFAGSYVGLHSRYAVQGKKVDNEKILVYSLMNIPQLGALQYMLSLSSPATVQTVSDAMSLIGASKK